mmetsp:Transcript_39259/g.108177  ORF Transcript_39259/g.108177 Transcript_39259/m.108177 type:complete len:437 (+) Transcript_39259:77-1387(+)
MTAHEARQQALASFQQLDRDGNGLLDPEELGLILRKLDPGVFGEDAVREIFAAADANRDGKVDVGEFLSWVFQDAVGAELMAALSKARMQTMSMRLLSTDLAWMKHGIDNAAFTNAVLNLTHPKDNAIPHLEVESGARWNRIFDVSHGVDTLASAHALLSVDEHWVPEGAYLAPAQRCKGGFVVIEPLTAARAAPLVYAALVVGCKHVTVTDAEWGDMLTEAIEYGLEGSATEVLEITCSNIDDPEAMVRILDGIDEESMLHTVDLSNNVVGLEGLRSLHDALARCARLRNLFLYNIGPWIDGNGLGCQRGPESEETLEVLTTLRELVKQRGGAMQNEAFREGDVDTGGDDGMGAKPERDARPSRSGTVLNTRAKGGRVMLRSSPSDVEGRCCAWAADGEPVHILKDSHDGQWANVRTCSLTPAKGWLKTSDLHVA